MLDAAAPKPTSKRHFRRFGRFRSEADIQQAALTGTNLNWYSASDYGLWFPKIISARSDNAGQIGLEWQ
jgi:hypothetical protein